MAVECNGREKKKKKERKKKGGKEKERKLGAFEQG